LPQLKVLEVLKVSNLLGMDPMREVS